MKTANVAKVIFAATLFGATATTRAADGHIAATMVTTVGQWIAAQGNAALRDIRQDMKRELLDRFEPLLPAIDAPASAPIFDPRFDHKAGVPLEPAAPQQSL